MRSSIGSPRSSNSSPRRRYGSQNLGDLEKAAQAIIQNDNANYRQLHDEILANRFADLQQENQQLRTQLQQEQLAASQLAQTDSIIAQLRPAAVPAYTVPNPWQGYIYGGCGCGLN